MFAVSGTRGINPSNGPAARDSIAAIGMKDNASRALHTVLMNGSPLLQLFGIQVSSGPFTSFGRFDTTEPEMIGPCVRRALSARPSFVGRTVLVGTQVRP